MKELIDKMFKSKVMACLENYDNCEMVYEYDEYWLKVGRLSNDTYMVVNSNEDTFTLTSKLSDVELLFYVVDYKYIKDILDIQRPFDIVCYNFIKIAQETKSIYECVETIIKSQEYIYLLLATLVTNIFRRSLINSQ